MPSPFPGMDPFLELPEFFPDLHDRFVPQVSVVLQSRLPSPYYAIIGSRVWVPHDEHRDTFVDIYTTLGGERLVTTIELLSMTNKTPGQHGRDLYVRKQRELLYGKVHLVEIDLLRGGQHTTAVPEDLARAKCGPFDYHAVVHRFDNLEDFFVYPVRIEQRLPTIGIPLLPGDPDIPLDLRAVFDHCYDTGPYRRRVHYQKLQLAPPLATERAAWVRERLKGLSK
jgi:hypothetical protein